MRSLLPTTRHRVASRRRLALQHHHAALATRRRAPHLVGLLLIGVLAAACGNTADAAAPSGPETPDTEAPADVIEEPGDPEPDAPIDPDLSDHAPGPDGDDAPEGDAATGVLTLAFDEQTLAVAGADGGELFAWELASSRGEEVTHVAVRPGASATDLDAVVTVLRGEVPFLYQLTVRDGRDAAFGEVPAHLQPQDVIEAVIAPTFTPDGASVLWTEPTGDGVTLRSFGWDDGAGTGRTADDNASFALDLPADIGITGFHLAGDDTAGASATAWTVLFTDGIGRVHGLDMVRQADGALALVG